MNLFRPLSLALLAITVLGAACERPSSPDFTTSQAIEFPLFQDRSFQFMGSSASALIDTTTPDFEGLFSIDSESFVSLGITETFDFGDLEDAIPVISIDPNAFEAAVGPVKISNFSSASAGGELGRATFEQLTGLDPALFGEGTFVPGSSSPWVNIDLDTDYLVSATIVEGLLEIVLENQMGLDLDLLQLRLNSGGLEVETVDFTDLLHGDVATESMLISPGQVLQDLNVDVRVEWGPQTTQADPDALIIRDVAGQGLTASEIEAVVPPQEFAISGNNSIPADQFLFSDPGHYIELEEGSLSVDQIVNNLDLGIDVLRISFPGIRTAPYGEADSLVIEFSGPERIERKSSNPEGIVSDLSGLRVYAEGNRIDYNLYALTEDTRTGQGADPRTLNQDDDVRASIQIEGLVLGSAVGVIANRDIVLNDDSPDNGIGVLDLMNDLEAQIIEVEGLNDLSDQLEGIEFTNARLRIEFETNIGVPTEVVGSFMGVAGGQNYFLAGKAGENTYAGTGNIPGGMLFDGTPLDSDQLIRFDIPPGDGTLTTHVIEFDRDNSTIIQFLNRLPGEVRFIGKANLNSDDEVGVIVNPVRFEPTITVDIPLSIQTLTAAIFRDTTDQDMSDLPGDGDDSSIDEATLTIQYANGFPLEISLSFEFLDEEGAPVTTIPLEGQIPIAMQAATVSQSGYSDGESEGSFAVSLNRDQLRDLSRARSMIYNASLMTSDQQEVRLKATDVVRFSAGVKLVLETDVK